MIMVLSTFQEIYTKMRGLFFVHMIDEMTAIAIWFTEITVNNFHMAHPRYNNEMQSYSFIKECLPGSSRHQEHLPASFSHRPSGPRL